MIRAETHQGRIQRVSCHYEIETAGGAASLCDGCDAGSQKGVAALRAYVDLSGNDDHETLRASWALVGRTAREPCRSRAQRVRPSAADLRASSTSYHSFSARADNAFLGLSLVEKPMLAIKV